MRRGNSYQSLGCKAESIKTGTMGHAVFGECHVFGDPEHVRRRSRNYCQTQSKAGRCGEVGFTRCRNFVQSAAHETATKRGIDGRNNERQGVETVRNTGRPLQGQKALAELLDHLQAFEDTETFGRKRAVPTSHVHDLF